MKKELPSQDYLNSLFEYIDGLLYWKIAKPKVKIGMLAGCINSRNYAILKLEGKEYKQHNIIWKMLTGNDPVGEIDHIKKSIPVNNRIENLRDVTHQENGKNQCKNKKNTSGYNNIIIRKTGKKRYQVQFNAEKYSKCFLTLDEAIQHRDEKYIEFGYHQNHGLGLVAKDSTV